MASSSSSNSPQDSDEPKSDDAPETGGGDGGDDKIRQGDYAHAKGEVVLRPHEYDGIQEYDQKLPNWWLMTFYGAIIFFLGGWFAYYTLGVIETDGDRMDAHLAELEAKRDAARESALSSLTDRVFIEEWAVDSEKVAAGEAAYMTICHSCHAADLSAKMGPVPLPGRPLDDGVWEYGKAPMAIFNMIDKGTPEGAPGFNGMPMIAKAGLDFTPEQIAQMTAFLISKNPADFEGATYNDDGSLVVAEGQ